MDNIREQIDKILIEYLGTTSVSAVDELVGIIEDEVNKAIDEMFPSDTNEGAY